MFGWLVRRIVCAPWWLFGRSRFDGKVCLANQEST